MTKSVLITAFIFFLAAVGGVSSFGQSESSKQLTKQLEDVNLRIEKTQDKMNEAALRLSPAWRAVLFARLGESLFNDSSEQSQMAFDRSIKDLETALKSVEEAKLSGFTEEKIDRERLVRFVGIVFKILIQRDKKNKPKILEIVTRLGELPAVGGSGNQDDIADVFAEAADAILQDDPKLASKLVSKSLDFGKAQILSPVLIKVRQIDPSNADKLFTEALKKAQIKHDLNLYTTLIGVSYPAWVNYDPEKTPIPNEALRKLLFQALSDELTGGSNPKCFTLGLIAPYTKEYEQLTPQNIAIIRQVGKECETQNSLMPSFGNQSVDELLSEAEKATDVNSRVVYKAMAVKKAKDDRNSSRALEILNDMTDEERKGYGEDAFDGFRSDIIVQVAFENYEQGDLIAARKLIGSASSKWRSWVALQLAKKLSAKEDTQGFIFELVTTARKSLSQEGSEYYSFEFQMDLIEQYSRTSPTEYYQILRELVKNLNALQTTDKAFENEAAVDLEAFTVPGILAGNHFEDSFLAFLDINSPVLRSRAYYALLDDLIQQRLKLKKRLKMGVG